MAQNQSTDTEQYDEHHELINEIEKFSEKININVNDTLKKVSVCTDNRRVKQ